jgi:hypothetical protein
LNVILALKGVLEELLTIKLWTNSCIKLFNFLHDISSVVPSSIYVGGGMTGFNLVFCCTDPEGLRARGKVLAGNLTGFHATVSGNGENVGKVDFCSL